MKARDLLGRHPEVWREAINHPFLDGVRGGELPASAFERWLVQDYLYVRDLLGFQARLLARTPRPAQAVVAGGLVALEAELSWFEDLAGRRGLSLDVSRHPTTVAYRKLLDGLEGESYGAGITGLWTIETAYLEAWTGSAPGHPEYREFVEHWTTPEFSGYVSGLEQAVGAALETASKHELERAEEAFLAVARLERDFWGMALSGEER